MSDQLKMDLRRNRRPRYRPQDQQDPDNPCYTRPNYLKMNTTPITQQFISLSVILNQNAKLLLKFISKANKSFKNISLSKDQLEKETIKKESLPKNKNITEHIQNGKKQLQTLKNQKTQAQKKSKTLYNFKEIHQNSEMIKNLTQQQVIKGVKNLSNLQGFVNNKGIYSGPLSNQLSQLQSLYPNLKDFNYETLTQSPNPNLFQFDQQKQSLKAPTKSLANQSSVKPKPVQNRQPKKSMAQMLKEIEKNKEQKIFRRSAYHVAIAYHIYLKGLYEQGITSGNLIDPTYKARLVKQQAGMVNEDQ